MHSAKVAPPRWLRDRDAAGRPGLADPSEGKASPAPSRPPSPVLGLASLMLAVLTAFLVIGLRAAFVASALAVLCATPIGVLPIPARIGRRIVPAHLHD